MFNVNSTRTLSGTENVRAGVLELAGTQNAIRIDGNKGVAGQVISKNDITNKLEWDFATNSTIPANSIPNSKLVDKTIENTKIKDGTIISSLLADALSIKTLTILTQLILPETIDGISINGQTGDKGQVLSKNENTNKLEWSFVDKIAIPDNSISGDKLKDDITISTTGNITANTITATNTFSGDITGALLTATNQLILPETIDGISINGQTGIKGQVLSKNEVDNKLEWSFVDKLAIPNDSISGDKLTNDITISTTGDITASTITATDHFAQSVGTTTNTFLGDITTNKSLGAVLDVIANRNITGPVVTGTTSINGGAITGTTLNCSSNITSSGSITATGLSMTNTATTNTIAGSLRTKSFSVPMSGNATASISSVGAIVGTSLNCGSGKIETNGVIESATITTTGDITSGGLNTNGDINSATLTTTGDIECGGDLEVTGDMTYDGDLTTQTLTTDSILVVDKNNGNATTIVLDGTAVQGLSRAGSISIAGDYFNTRASALGSDYTFHNTGGMEIGKTDNSNNGNTNVHIHGSLTLEDNFEINKNQEFKKAGLILTGYTAGTTKCEHLDLTDVSNVLPDHAVAEPYEVIKIIDPVNSSAHTILTAEGFTDLLPNNLGDTTYTAKTTNVLIEVTFYAETSGQAHEMQIFEKSKNGVATGVVWQKTCRLMDNNYAEQGGMVHKVPFYMTGLTLNAVYVVKPQLGISTSNTSLVVKAGGNAGGNSGGGTTSFPAVRVFIRPFPQNATIVNPTNFSEASI